MRSKLIIPIYAIFLIAILFSCEKEVTGDIEIFLLSDFSTVDNSFEIVSGSEQLEIKPLITYNDIISYDDKDFIFQITDNGKSAILDLELEQPGSTRAFAVLAGNKIIYTGYFWLSYSSLSCDWVQFWPPLSSNSDNKILVVLGYEPSGKSPDKRNSKEIIRILERDSKLI